MQRNHFLLRLKIKLAFISNRDSFCAPEVEIFKAVHNWVRVNSDEDGGEEFLQILSEVRLSLIPTQDLLKYVRPTNLVQPDKLLDAIQARTEFRDMELKYRGYLSMSFKKYLCKISK